MPAPVGALSFSVGTQGFVNQQAGVSGPLRQRGGEFGVSRKDDRRPGRLDTPSHRTWEMIHQEWAGIGGRPQLHALTFLGWKPAKDLMPFRSGDDVLIDA